MAADLILRPVTPADLAGLHRLDQRCFTVGIAYALAEMRAILRSPAPSFHAAFAAAATPDPIAAFILTLRERGQGHIITVDVAPEHRRRGLGLALMQAAEAHWRAQGARALRLEVAVNNAAALAFYARLGFHIARSLPGYYARDLDGLEMEKLLPAGPRPPQPGRR